ncbi:MAG: hypothetical protein HOO06_07445 [Bdellovibrionaceae bacterium]|jgi:hypothetical protein|nr:hypothetical protein [Pseudobdellovibrionaceae bacterium]
MKKITIALIIAMSFNLFAKNTYLVLVKDKQSIETAYSLKICEIEFERVSRVKMAKPANCQSIEDAPDFYPEMLKQNINSAKNIYLKKHAEDIDKSNSKEDGRTNLARKVAMGTTALGYISNPGFYFITVIGLLTGSYSYRESKLTGGGSSVLATLLETQDASGITNPVLLDGIKNRDLILAKINNKDPEVAERTMLLGGSLTKKSCDFYRRYKSLSHCRKFSVGEFIQEYSTLLSAGPEELYKKMTWKLQRH